MARKIEIGQISETIEKELQLYHQDVLDKVKDVSRETMKQVVKETKAFRFKQDTGRYRRNITSRVAEESTTGILMQWYVKPPDHRLTHLLDKGHMTLSGGRTRGYGFVSRSEENGIKYQTDKLLEVLQK